METPEESSRVRIFDDAAKVAEAAALRFIELAREAITERGRFTVALAGGSTPKLAYRLLASAKSTLSCAQPRAPGTPTGC